MVPCTYDERNLSNKTTLGTTNIHGPEQRGSKHQLSCFEHFVPKYCFVHLKPVHVHQNLGLQTVYQTRFFGE